MNTHRRDRCSALTGFTVTELVVLVAVGALLFLLLGVGRAGTRSGGRVFQCLNNQRQLLSAFHMYAAEHNGRLPFNWHWADRQQIDGWVSGNLDWTTASANTNVSLLTNDSGAVLARYIGRAYRVYQCPANTFLSQPQRAQGWASRVRSYSMNSAFGDGNATQHPWNPANKQIRNLNELQYPTFAEAFVFTEEHPDSLNDGQMMPPDGSGNWISAPGNYHDGAGVFAFADGHGEIHKWQGSLVYHPRARYVAASPGNSLLNFGVWTNDADVRWVNVRIPRTSATR